MFALLKLNCMKQSNGNEILNMKYHIIPENVIYTNFMQFISCLHVRVKRIYHEDDSNFSDKTHPWIKARISPPH